VWWTKAEAVGTIQRAIRDAAERQLAPFAGVGIPLVAVLTNPREADVSFDREDVISAVLGPVEYPVDPHTLELMQPTYAGGGVVLTRDANGTWSNPVPHLSAVVTLYGLPDFPHMDVYDLSRAPGFAGTPLPRTMFDGANHATRSRNAFSRREPASDLSPSAYPTVTLPPPARGEGPKSHPNSRQTAEWVGSDGVVRKPTPSGSQGAGVMTTETTPHVDSGALAELHRLARSRPRSGRGQTAKLGAIRTLERLGRGSQSTVPMPEGWHPRPGSGWEELDACDSLETRERWWRHLHS
jgi:hypothetical protein